jgi:nicotinate-nucleotide pyrophosphorylase (carboxylating)
MRDLTPQAIRPLIRRALAEDGVLYDLTSHAVTPKSLRIEARVVAKSPGIAAGIQAAALTFTTMNRALRVRRHVRPGAPLSPGTVILTVTGRAQSIFAAERTALNFLGHLSGVATLTAEYVLRIRGTRAKIVDTRKTTPGFRALEKDAVRAGGGTNHRYNLADQVLIKTNHLKLLYPEFTSKLDAIEHALAMGRSRHPRRIIGIEVADMEEFEAALTTGTDLILLDNWPVSRIPEAVRMRRRYPKTLLEFSGGVTLANVRAIANTGVDRISIGRLTHSAPSLDVSLEVI